MLDTWLCGGHRVGGRRLEVARRPNGFLTFFDATHKTHSHTAHAHAQLLTAWRRRRRRELDEDDVGKNGGLQLSETKRLPQNHHHHEQQLRKREWDTTITTTARRRTSHKRY